MSAARHLTVIDTQTGEVIEAQDPLDEVKALRASLARQEKIITALRNDKARARKEYTRRATVEEIFEQWQHAAGKARSKLTDDRFDAIRALLEMKDPYTVDEFKLMLAGLTHYPFVVYGTRRSTGSEESRKVDICFICEKGRRFEELANLGYMVEKARVQGDGAVNCENNEIGAATRQRPAPRPSEGPR